MKRPLTIDIIAGLTVLGLVVLWGAFAEPVAPEQTSIDDMTPEQIEDILGKARSVVLQLEDLTDDR